MICLGSREPFEYVPIRAEPDVGKSVGILLPIYRGPAVINIVIRTKI